MEDLHLNVVRRDLCHHNDPIEIRLCPPLVSEDVIQEFEPLGSENYSYVSIATRTTVIRSVRARIVEDEQRQPGPEIPDPIAIR